MPDPGLCDRDFYAWANEQAALLRAGQLSAADIAHIAEEIESMGKTETRELVNRLAVLLMHLLKWQYQSSLRGKSRRVTVEEQRRQLVRHLRDNPSLKGSLPEAMADSYGDAILAAARETDLEAEIFPAASRGRSPRSWTRAFGRKTSGINRCRIQGSRTKARSMYFGGGRNANERMQRKRPFG